MFATRDLDALIHDIEDRVLSAFFTHSYRAAAGSALAHGLLREAAASTFAESGDVVWLALVSPPFEPDAWCVISTREGLDKAMPLELVAPSRPADRIARLGTELTRPGPGARLQPARAVPISEFGSWNLIEGVAQVFATYVEVSIGVDRPGMEGVLLVALSRTIGSAVTGIEDALEHACGCLRDRLRLAYAAEATPVRVLASVDDAFQEELAQAREARGLREFLIALEEGGAVVAAAAGTAAETLDLDSAVQAGAQIAGSDAEAVRRAFELAVVALHPEGPKTITQLRVSDSEDPLVTPIGHWLGWCEYRYGLADLRSRPAVLTVARDALGLNRELARFVRRSRDREAGLIVFAPKSFEAAARQLLLEWNDVLDAAVHTIPE